MKNKLENKIAVISGGDSGIGLAISKRLKAENVKIFNISKGGEALDLFEKSFACDISDDAKVKTVVDEIMIGANYTWREILSGIIDWVVATWLPNLTSYIDLSSTDPLV